MLSFAASLYTELLFKVFTFSLHYSRHYSSLTRFISKTLLPNEHLPHTGTGQSSENEKETYLKTANMIYKKKKKKTVDQDGKHEIQKLLTFFTC